jgi:putative salt-induced outer membrane protein YdiY
VSLKNGDRITGEIMSMKLGKLAFKMDGPGTISIKWEYVTEITSNKVFDFTLRNGEIVVSSLDSLFQSHHGVSLDDIIEITPIKDRFLKRLVGDVNLGFNYTKSNSILQSNFSSNISYIIPKRQLNLKLNSVLTNYGKDTSLTKKQDVIASFRRDFSKKYFWATSLGWQQNTELGLASRYLVSAAAGWQPLTDNHNRLLASAGLSYNQEQSIETGQFTGNLDALFEIAYKRFYYSTPKLSIDADYLIYPGLSDWGRIRMQSDLNVSVEIFSDFQVGLVFYYSYDNKPPEGSSSTNDFGVMFTLGYEFGK